MVKINVRPQRATRANPPPSSARRVVVAPTIAKNALSHSDA